MRKNAQGGLNNGQESSDAKWEGSEWKSEEGCVMKMCRREDITV